MRLSGILPGLILMTILSAGCKNNLSGPGGSGKVDYDSHFTGERLRLDLVFCGNHKTQSAFLKEMHREPVWAGSPESLIDDFGYGEYCYKLYDKGQLVFSSGFCTIFDEWRTTAQDGEVSMAGNQSLWMPFPRNKMHFVLYQRIRKNGRFKTMLEFDIDPEDRHIIPGPDNNWPVRALRYTGDSRHKVDLVFVGEGYTSSQMQKLRDDAKRIADYFFSMEPYASRQNDFNVWLVESVSEDGGAGIYGSYAMGTSDNKRSLPVTIHEFGHSFAGLGDEYYDSETAYEEFYPLKVEPWEPNVTTNVDFASKWKDMVEAGTPVPTPNDSSHIGKVGLFEGAGYMARGCYRPYFECRMLNNTAPCFCPVCQRAINAMINRYTE